MKQGTNNPSILATGKNRAGFAKQKQMEKVKTLFFDLKTPDTHKDWTDNQIPEKIKQDWESINHELVDFHLCKHEDDLVHDFKQALEKAKAKDLALGIAHFSLLSKKVDFYILLKESDLEFKIFDFVGLNQKGLDVLTPFLIKQNQEKSTKISAALEKRKAKGHKLGNPNIAAPEVQKPAKIKRSMLALRDKNNLKARREIKILREEQELNFSQIAEQLNIKGLRTRRGSQFHAKSIQRLYETQKDLEKSFNPNKELEDLVLDDLVHAKNDLKDQSSSRMISAHFSDPGADNRIDTHLKIIFDNEVNGDIQLTIANNKKEKVFKDTILKGSKSYMIDLLKNNILLPGRYYIRLEAKGYKPFITSLKIMEGLL